MQVRKSILVISVFTLLTACGSSPEKDKARAEAEYTEEKTKTLQEYKDCVKKAKDCLLYTSDAADDLVSV